MYAFANHKTREYIRQVLGTAGTALAFLICGFVILCFFVRSRFRASKTAATNGHPTVCDLSWPPFLGSPGGPCFEIVIFFYGLEIQVPIV